MNNADNTITYRVEFATGSLTTTDYDEARAMNRANPGSSLDRIDN